MLMSEFPVVSVHIPPGLRDYAGGHDEVMASGETVGEILQALGHTYPALGRRLLCRDGQLVEGLSVYLGAASLRECCGLATPVAAEEVLTLVLTGGLSCPPGQAPLPLVEHEEGAPLGEISIGD